MADFPRAWGACDSNGRWTGTLWDIDPRDINPHVPQSRRVVELVPLPEVERLIAEAVAAADEEWLEKRHDAEIEMRDRCAAICEQHYKASDRPHPDYAESAVLRACEMIEAKIREVIP